MAVTLFGGYSSSSSSSSSSVTATAVNKLIILSLLKGRLHCERKKNKKQKKNTYVASLEALDTKVPMVVASTVVWGRL